jgi:hypothetical protein
VKGWGASGITLGTWVFADKEDVIVLVSNHLHPEMNKAESRGSRFCCIFGFRGSRGVGTKSNTNAPVTAGLGKHPLNFVQDQSDFSGQVVHGERLLQELDSGIQDPVMNDRILRVSGDVENPHFRKHGREQDE